MSDVKQQELVITGLLPSDEGSEELVVVLESSHESGVMVHKIVKAAKRKPFCIQGQAQSLDFLELSDEELKIVKAVFESVVEVAL